MDFVGSCFDEGAPEIAVSGVAGVERVSPNQMGVTYFRERKGERTAVIHIIWDRDQWLAMWRLWDETQAMGQQ